MQNLIPEVKNPHDDDYHIMYGVETKHLNDGGEAMEMARLQRDVIDSPANISQLQTEHNLLAYPWFPLSRHPQENHTYFDAASNIWFEVEGGTSKCPTAYDKDLLIYVGALLVQKKERGELQLDGSQQDRTIIFTLSDFNKVTSRDDDSGSGYKRFQQMFARLRQAEIRTNIEVQVDGSDERIGEDAWWSWFESGSAIRYTAMANGKRRVRDVKVVLSIWFYGLLVSNSSIVHFKALYFKLPPLGKALYDQALIAAGYKEMALGDFKEMYFKGRMSLLVDSLRDVLEKFSFGDATISLLVNREPMPAAYTYRRTDEIHIAFRSPVSSNEIVLDNDLFAATGA